MNEIILGIIITALCLVLAIVPQNSITGFGYKFPSALKNLDTWNEANKSFGIYGTIIGISLIIIGVLNYFNIITFSAILYAIPAGLFVISVILIEVHMKNTFTKDGKRK